MTNFKVADYYDDRFFKKLFHYEYSALCSYHKSIGARRTLSNLWNLCFPQFAITDLTNDDLLDNIINYNNQFIKKTKRWENKNWWFSWPNKI